MNELNLRAVRELLPFKELFPTSNDYLREASFLPHRELASTPLYELMVEQRVLFSPKLRYYRLKVACEINRHLNLTISHEDEYIIHYILKLTREAVETLIHEANEELSWLDADGAIWRNLSSDRPDLQHTAIARKEHIVFLHLVIAELVRCWMELQDSYADLLGAASRYDVPLCYTTFAGQLPNKVFEVRQTEPAKENAKKDTHRTDCCFLYNNDNTEYFNMAITEFTDKLHRRGLVPEKNDFKDFRALFGGRPCLKTIIWLGNNHILTHFIKRLCPDKKGERNVITPWPEGSSKWKVISQRFVDKEGNPLPDIHNEKVRKKDEPLYDELVSAFTAYLPKTNW